VRLSAKFTGSPMQRFDTGEHRQECLWGEVAEKLAIRKCFLVCCEGVSANSNNGIAIRTVAMSGLQRASCVPSASCAWTTSGKDDGQIFSRGARAKLAASRKF
jgi:hypothetical protein